MDSASIRTIAVFDCDDTLTRGDSCRDFLIAMVGWPHFILAVGRALFAYAKDRQTLHADPDFDRSTFVKKFLLHDLLTGRKVSECAAAIEAVRNKRQWKDAMKQALLDHKRAGHHIVIASGALDLYLAQLLGDLPYDAIICTEMEQHDGMLSGAMSSGNCVRKRKAELVEHYLLTHGPFTESWGYGNYPDDVPMLNLLKHRILV